MKNILFTLDDYHISGVSSFVRIYSQILSKKHRVIILGRTGNIKNPKTFFPKCKVLEIKQKTKSSIYGKLVDSIYYIKTLNRIYKKYDINIIHFSTTWSTFYSLLHPLTWSKKRLITFYGAYDLERESAKKHNPKMKNSSAFSIFLEKNAQKITLICSHNIITFSKYAKSLLISHYGEKNKHKITIIPGLVEIKNNNPIKQKEFTILNFGRAEPRKGINILLKAVKNITQKNIKVKLYIASPISYLRWSKYLEIYEEENLFISTHFIHAVSKKQQEELLKMADVFVIPSIELETFGLTIIESLSYGIPVIGASSGAIPEILNLIDPRLIFKNQSINSLTNKLIWFHQLKKSELLKLQKKCKKVVSRNFSYSKSNKKKVLDLY